MPLDDVNGSHGNGRPAGLPVGLLFRKVNDQIRELAGRFGDDEAGIFVCECDDEKCWAAVPLSMSEYDTARLNPCAALLAPDHADRILEQNPS
jgi:hypothetical protein